MIVSKIQMQPKPGNAVPTKTSPASNSAAPEIYASHGKIQRYAFPFEESRSTIPGYDVKDWLTVKHRIADDPIPPRSSDTQSN